MQNRVVRLAVVAIAAVVVFAATAWVAGALILPHWIKDHVDRWAVAAAAAVTAGGLVGVFGEKFVSAQSEDHARRKTRVTSSGKRSVAIGGDLTGIATTGDGARHESTPGQEVSASPTHTESPREVKAKGERSIAIGGSASGVVSTGDEDQKGSE